MSRRGVWSMIDSKFKVFRAFHLGGLEAAMILLVNDYDIKDIPSNGNIHRRLKGIPGALTRSLIVCHRKRIGSYSAFSFHLVLCK